MTDDAWSAAQPYEPFMGRWSRLLADEVMTWLDPPPAVRWLDVGCGTGAASATVLARAKPLSLQGIDPSAAYVAAASAHLDDPRATFTVGDASALSVPDSSVDQVICGLALNFVPDPVGAVREMRRVLVVGGRATAYVWDYADGMEMLRRFWDAAIADDPCATALDEGHRFPLSRPGRLERCFLDAGLVDVAAAAIEIPTVFRDFDDFWLPFLGGQGPAPTYCASLPAHDRERLRRRLRETLPIDAGGAIRLTARAWAATGTT